MFVGNDVVPPFHIDSRLKKAGGFHHGSVSVSVIFRISCLNGFFPSMDSRAKKVGNGKEVESVHSTAERRGVSYEFDDGSRIKTALSRSSLSLDIPPRITSAPILLQESPMMLPNTQVKFTCYSAIHLSFVQK